MESRPWGFYKSIYKMQGFQVKHIVVYPDKRISLQSHNQSS
jgi:mannose-6-phosphate isomerase-like protein (cupin superfamily)